MATPEEARKQYKEIEKSAKEFSSAIGGADSMMKSLLRSVVKVKELGENNSKVYQEHIDLANLRREQLYKKIKELERELEKLIKKNKKKEKKIKKLKKQLAKFDLL